MQRKKILFICTHNSARSQMAEGFVRALYPDDYEVFSGGIEPSKVNPYEEILEQIRKVRDEIKEHNVPENCLSRNENCAPHKS